MRVTQEVKQKIRKEVANENSRYKVAKKFGVSVRTVYNLTDDLPKRKIKRLDKKTKEEIRELVRRGLSKSEVARMFDVSYPTVYHLTKDLPSKGRGNRDVSRRTLNFLEKLLKDGYFIPENNLEGLLTLNTFRLLKEKFPIRRVKIYDRKVRSKKVMYFLEGRNMDAFRKFMEMRGNKVVNFRVLAQIASAFGVKLSSKEKSRLLKEET